MADLRVVEVVLSWPFGGAGGLRVERERDERRLVVHPGVEAAFASRLERDPVRDGFEAVPAGQRLAHCDDRCHRRRRRRREHRPLRGLEAAVVVGGGSVVATAVDERAYEST